MKKKTFRSLPGFVLCLCIVSALAAFSGTAIAKYVTDIETYVTLTVEGYPPGYVVLVKETDANTATHIYFGSVEEFSDNSFIWDDNTNYTGFGDDLENVRLFKKILTLEGGGVQKHLYYLTEKKNKIIVNSNSSWDETEIDAYLFPDWNETIVHIDLSRARIEHRDASDLFYQLGALESYILPAHVDAGEDMYNMFTGCKKLTSVDLSCFDTSSVGTMQHMFDGCSALTQINFGENLDTSKVTDFYDMFKNCTALKTLDLSAFDTAKGDDFFEMFSGCTVLESIYVGDDWNIISSQITRQDNMFNDCTALIGGEGTKYDAGHVDTEYARVDGGEDNPGYLTHISAKNTTKAASYALAAAPAYSLPEGVRAGETVLCVGMPEAMAYIMGDAHLSAAADEKFIGWLVQMDSQSQQVDIFNIESFLEDLFEVYPNAAVDLTPLYEKLS